MNRTPPRRSRRWTIAIALGAGAAIVSTALVAARAATPPHLPFGNVDWARQTTTGLAVAGWAIDPDTTAPIDVHVYMDGKLLGRAHAANARSDIANKYHLGANHGFIASFSVPAGQHGICVYAINVGKGSGNPRIGCRTMESA